MAPAPRSPHASPSADDADLRVACFRALDALRARCGEDLPWTELSKGFEHRGQRVPFKHAQQGIYRAAAQAGPAALSIATSPSNPYGDDETDDGFWYRFEHRPDAHTNRALAAAFDRQVPLVYFQGTRASWWRAVYPCFLAERADDGVSVVAGDATAQPGTVLVPPVNARRWTFREARVRLHQGRFRAEVLTAYRDQCAVCRLKESTLLDAAHILPDLHPRGDASVTNGLSLCSIHHRAYDQNLIGVAPDYTVHVARALLEKNDGPMLSLLKQADAKPIEVPRAREHRPDPDRLAERFKLFTAA